MLEGFVNVSPLLKPGIYALMREGVVVYIGQSKKPLSRSEAHRSLWGRTQRSRAPGWLPIKAINFDEVHVLPCPIEKLDEMERALVDLYKPRYNVKLKTPHPTTTGMTITLTDGTSVPFNVPRAAPQPFARRL